MFVVMTAVPDASVGAKLAEQIVTERLAACVQILPPMTSVYRWEGEVQKASECLLLVKTLPELWGALYELISKNHPYKVPEIAAIETSEVSESYRAWLEASVSN